MKSGTLRWLLVPLAVVALTVGAWLLWSYRFIVFESDDFSSRLREAACKSSTNTVALATLTNTNLDWDRVVILTPYEDRKSLEKALGYSWTGYWPYDDALGSEGQDVLFFLRDNKIVGVIDHPRDAGDFPDAISAKRINRADAVFRVVSRGTHCDWIGLAVAR